MEQIVWSVCALATIVTGVVAGRSDRARLAGRAAVGVLFLFGGALVNAIYLATDVAYVEFADAAHFAWVTDTWRDVVGPNVGLFIGMLVVYEAIVGALVVSGGRRTQLGYVGVIGFYLALALFGWFLTVWALVMVPPMLLLLRAEQRTVAATVTPPVGQPIRVGAAREIAARR